MNDFTQNENSPANRQEQSLHPVVSVMDWVFTMLIMIIPLVNLVMLFVWAFGTAANPNKANWAKATLLFILISIILTVLFFIAFAGIFWAIFQKNFQY